MSSTSIIITNWNRWEEVEIILSLLHKKPEQYLEIIIVDNCSNQMPKFDWKSMEKTKFIFLKENYGPCVARNKGADLAGGKYLFFLDSDAICSRRCIKLIEDRFERENDLAVIGCRVEYKFNRTLDQWIYSQKKTRQKQKFDTYSFSACGAAIRSSVYRSIGGFNEKLFMYNEEVDLSYRVIQSGFRVAYDSDAVVYHFPSNKGRMKSSDFWRGMIRHWIWIFFSYYPTFEAYKRSLFYSAIYLLKGIRLGLLPAIIAGIYEGFKDARKVSGESEKLTFEKIKYLDTLNRRTKINWQRL